MRVSIQNELLASMGGAFIHAQANSFASDAYLTEQKVILASTAIRCATVHFSPGQKSDLLHNVLHLKSADSVRAAPIITGHRPNLKGLWTQIGKTQISSVTSGLT